MFSGIIIILGDNIWNKGIISFLSFSFLDVKWIELPRKRGVQQLFSSFFSFFVSGENYDFRVTNRNPIKHKDRNAKGCSYWKPRSEQNCGCLAGGIINKPPNGSWIWDLEWNPECYQTSCNLYVLENHELLIFS